MKEKIQNWLHDLGVALGDDVLVHASRPLADDHEAEADRADLQSGASECDGLHDEAISLS